MEFEQTDHRPFPLPEGKWVMRQIWHDLLFVHWPVKPERIVPHIPDGLRLDLWQDMAWITLSPFHIARLHMRGLPPLPFARSFCELNLRTYVTSDKKPGVYFFSLDASNRLAVEVARLAGLPYLNAVIRLEREEEKFHYTCQRTDSRGSSAEFTGTYYPTGREIFHAAPDTLLYWLTERYRLYFISKGIGATMAIDIHHRAWPLQPAALTIDKNTMFDSLGIPLPDEAPIATYSKAMDVLIWPIRKG